MKRPTEAERAEAFALLPPLAATVRMLDRVEARAVVASEEARTIASEAHAAASEGVRVWRDLCAALVDGAGYDRSPAIADTIAAAAALMAATLHEPPS